MDYLLADHLGGTTAAVGSNGSVLSTQKYWPYGATRTATGTLPTDKLYTGQQVEPGDAALALYDYKARFYSTVLGRFVSADSVMPKKNDPVDLDRFAYVRDNPLRYTDPTGHCVGGKDAKCTPSIALNILACAASIEGCAAVNDMLGLGLSIDDIERIHTWAAGAVRLAEFWDNFRRPVINPLFGNNHDALLAAGYGRGLLGIDAESALFRVYQFAMQEDEKLVFTGPFSGLVDHVIDLLGSQGVKCAWMVGSVLAPYAGISVGTGLVIFTDGTGSEVGITIIGLSAKGIQNQASFPAETFKC